MTSRRDAIRALAGIAALPIFGKLGAQELFDLGRHAHTLAERRASAAIGAPRALTAAEYEMVVQAAERVLPRTATPGATDAKVADFIDVMLSDWYEAADRERFKAGLSDLDARAFNVANQSFVRLSEKQQIALLEALDRELNVRRQSREAGVDTHWFAMLKHLTIWGYYTSEPGILQELREQLLTGRYEGNAQY